MGCYTKKPVNDLNFVSARKANDVLITDLVNPIGECFLALSPPILLGAPASSTSIQLSWSEGVGGVEYELSQSLFEFSGFVLIDTLPGTDKLVTGLDRNKNYFFKVKYIGFGVESGFSNVASISTTIIEAPSELNITGVNIDRATINWTSNSLGGEDGFRIERGLNGISFPDTFDVATGVVIFNDTGLDAETDYFYRVKALDSVGGDSDYTSVEMITTLDFGMPIDLVVSSIIYNKVIAAWVSTSGGEEDGFSLERSLTAVGGFVEVETTTTGVVTVTDEGNGLKGNTEYFYRVKATDSSGDSDYSNVDSVTTGTSVLNLANPNGDQLTNPNGDKLVALI